jgi:ferredoxin-nitrite reductase
VKRACGAWAGQKAYPTEITWRGNLRRRNSVESLKAAKCWNPLRIRDDIPQLIAGGWENLSHADKDLLKWVGVFFRKPTPGKFMMRIRMPNGFATSEQLRTIAELSRRIGNGVLDITTRQQIELRGFTIDTVPEIWQKLRGVDLHSLQTGMDNVRNINGCALAGLTPHELFDASPVLYALDRIIVGTNGNPEFVNLPRKFNIVITGCTGNCTHAESQDVALVPATLRGAAGFNILVGGKMGSGGFTVATPLNVFVEPQDAAEVAAELVRIFRDHGPREARSQCRMAHLVADWGIDELRYVLCERLMRPLDEAGVDVRKRGCHHEDHIGIHPQKQEGLRSAGLCVINGRLNPDQLTELARLADCYGSGSIRFTTGQNAILPNVAVAHIPALLREPLLKELSPSPSAFLRGMVACTGTDFCNLAQIETKGYAVQLARALEQKLDTVRTPLTMHWSGCPAACGNHQAADIGFRGVRANVGGTIVDGVAIYTGGKTGRDATPGQEVFEFVPCDEHLPEVVACLIRERERTRAATETKPDLVEEIPNGLRQSV